MIKYQIIMSNLTIFRDIINIVVFHNPCQDGLGSAWIVQHYYNISNKPMPKFIGASYGNQIKYDNPNNMVILFVDFCPSNDDIKSLLLAQNKLLILDHHVTSQDRLKDCTFAIFDMTKSGVGLTWDYFFPDKTLPIHLANIEDRDLWKFKFNQTKEFTAGLSCLTETVNTLDEQFAILDTIIHNHTEYEKITNLGKALNDSKLAKVKRIAKDIGLKPFVFENHTFCVYNCNYEIASDLGNELSQSYCDFAVLWTYDFISAKYSYSLRSTNKVDVAEMCLRLLNGGGHKNAAGGSSFNHPEVVFGKIPYVESTINNSQKISDEVEKS